MQGQASVERVFNEYHPIGQQMLMQTASRMAASVLAIHNKARGEKGLGALPLVSMGGFARDILKHQAGQSWIPEVIKHMMHPEAWFRDDRFYGVSEGLITTTTETLSALSKANGGKRITVLFDDWTKNPDKREIARMRCRERGRIGGEASSAAAVEAAAEIDVLNADGVGDGLGVCLAGGVARVLALARELGTSPGLFLCVCAKCTGILHLLCLSPSYLSAKNTAILIFLYLLSLSFLWAADVVFAARCVAGGMGSAACERAAEALEIMLASGKGDGLGYAIAGGWKVLEPLAVAERLAAVAAARLKASKAGGAASCKVCARTAEALEVILASGKGDGLGYAIAGGWKVLEPLAVAERLAAVAAARLKASKAGGEASGATGASSKAAERAAKALGILDDAGNGDILGFCTAGGLAVLEHLSLQERLDAVRKARRKSSEAGNQAKKATREVCHFHCVVDSNCTLYC